MKLLHAICAGLDVHTRVIVAAVREARGCSPRRECRSFGTTEAGLRALRDWLRESGCTHVAMEATGVYWKPVWHVLEGHFELVLARASEVRNVPGRKSDFNDATWLADLLAHGLIRSSFVPPPEIQRLRDLTRTRKKLVGQCTEHVNRIHAVLEQAHFKLGHVLTNIMGKSGRAVLEALLDGIADAEELAQLVSPRAKASRSQIAEALDARVSDHDLFLLRLHLTEHDAARARIAEIDQRLRQECEPFRPVIQLLVTVPGFDVLTAICVLAEIGPDMSRFPSASHLVSWAGACPRLDESAGRIRSRRLRHGSPWLLPVLVQAAWAAVRVKDSYPKTLFLRVRGRTGAKKAIIAVAGSLLRSVYHMIERSEPYREPVPAECDDARKLRHAQRMAERIARLGFVVKLEPAA